MGIMKTHSVKQSEILKEWVLVDATNKTVGRLSSEIARVLRGKHKPTYTPHLDCGDFVVVVNAAKVHFTGHKWSDKTYHTHSGYVGGIKTTTATEMLKRKPERILELAIKGMLPKNKLGRKMAKNLKIYADDQHPHEAQKPGELKPRLAGREG
jgi:large subunit ribosomal protein L13